MDKVKYVLAICISLYLTQFLLFFFDGTEEIWGLSGWPYLLAHLSAVLIFIYYRKIPFQKTYLAALPACLLAIAVEFIRMPEENFIWNLTISLATILFFIDATKLLVDSKGRNIFVKVLPVMVVVLVFYYSIVSFSEIAENATRFTNKMALINSNTVAYMCMGMILFFDITRPYWLKYFSIAGYIPFLGIIAMFSCRGAFFAIFIYYLFKYRLNIGRFFFVFVSLFSSAILIVSLLDYFELIGWDKYSSRYSLNHYFNSYLDDERLNGFLNSLDNFFAHPFWGTPFYLSEDHNIWTKLLAAHGIIGFFTFLFFLFFVLRKLRFPMEISVVFILILNFAPLGPWVCMFIVLAVVFAQNQQSLISIQSKNSISHVNPFFERIQSY